MPSLAACREAEVQRRKAWPAWLLKSDSWHVWADGWQTMPPDYRLCVLELPSRSTSGRFASAASITIEAPRWEK